MGIFMMTIAHPSRLDDWILAVKQCNPCAYYWTRIFVGLLAAGPIVAVWEHTWYLPLPLLVGTIFATLGMLVVGYNYDGIVKSMGLPHAVFIGLPTIAMAQALFSNGSGNGVVALDDTPLSYVWMCTTVAFCCAMVVIDMWDTFEWFVLRNRKVTRSQQTVDSRELREEGHAPRWDNKRTMAHEARDCRERTLRPIWFPQTLNFRVGPEQICQI